MKKYLSVLLFFVFVSCSVDSDFGNSNWGDDIEKVTELNSDKSDFKLSDDMLSYKDNIDGSNVSISYLFEGGKLISGFIIFDKLPVSETKILYDTLLEKYNVLYETIIFEGNSIEMETEVFKQVIWDNNSTILSIRLDSNQIFIKSYDKHKMPVD